VSFELRKGTWRSRLVRAMITSPRQLRDLLMFCVSFVRACCCKARTPHPVQARYSFAQSAQLSAHKSAHSAALDTRTSRPSRKAQHAELEIQERAAWEPAAAAADGAAAPQARRRATQMGTALCSTALRRPGRRASTIPRFRAAKRANTINNARRYTRLPPASR